MIASDEQLGRPARREEGHVRRPDLKGPRDVEPGEQRLDHPLDAEHPATADQGQSCRLFGKLLAWPRKVDVGDLEQLGVGVAVRLVVPTSRQQARHERLPQGPLPLPAGVLHADRGQALADRDRLAELVGHQAEGHRLVEPAGGQRSTNQALDALPVAPRGAGQGNGAVLGDVVVAVDPRDLLDQVDLALQVAPPARRAEGQ